MSHDVEELLREAGARWRAEQPPPVEPTSPVRRPPWRRHATVLAAAAAVVVVVAGALIGGRALSHKRAATPTPAVSPTPAPTGPTGLVIHDGDTAEATGLVLAVSGRPVLFCPEMPIMDPGSTDRLGTCATPLAITATGVDLARLTDREEVAHGTIKGRAVLRGVYTGGTLRVTRQSPMPPRTTTDPNAGLPAILRTPPCAAPSGRWHGQANVESIGAYTRMRPSTFNGLGVSYPFPPHFTVTVAVVGVAHGNLAAVQADLRARFGPNICAVHVDFTALEQKRVQDAVDQLGMTNGIYGSGGPGNFRPVTVSINIITPERFAKLQRIGLRELELHVWLKPVR